MNRFKNLFAHSKNHPLMRYLGNKYSLSLIVFAFWMLFLDTHSWVIHRELNAEIKELQKGINYYNAEIAQDKEFLNELQNKSDHFEKFAREQYWLKKNNEEIFLIEREDES